MMRPDDAIRLLVDHARPVESTESVPLKDALGRILAGPVISGVDVPPADNSAMDGYAFRHGDLPPSGGRLPVSGRIPAGQAPGDLAPGSAVRIFTGAEIPAGADTVVMQEHCRSEDGAVFIETLPPRGAHIRPRGQDIRRDQELLSAGPRLRAQELGLLASVGLGEVTVRRRLRVAVVSNGDELVEPGHPLARGQIYNSNRYLLTGLLRDWGFEPMDLGIARDEPKAIAEALSGAASLADVILSSGGVSVGEEDHVKAVVESLGGLDLWKIAMKPGKPLAFGRVGDTPFLGLPGNPASALVTALVIARPFLFACQGRADTLPASVPMPAAFDRPGGSRQEYLRVRIGPRGLELHPNQSSGVLLSSSWGDGLAVQPPDRDVRAGDALDFCSWAAYR